MPICQVAKFTCSHHTDQGPRHFVFKCSSPGDNIHTGINAYRENATGQYHSCRHRETSGDVRNVQNAALRPHSEEVRDQKQQEVQTKPWPLPSYPTFLSSRLCFSSAFNAESHSVCEIYACNADSFPNRFVVLKVEGEERLNSFLIL